MSDAIDTIDTTPLRQAATSQPWPWSVHTNPIILAILTMTTGVITYTAAQLADLKTWHAGLFAAALGAAAIVHAINRHLHPSAIAYSITTAILSATWITYATSTDTITHHGIITPLAVGALLLPWYLQLLAWRKRHTNGTVAAALATDPTTPDAPATTAPEVSTALSQLGARGLTYLHTHPTVGGQRHDFRMAANGTLYDDLVKLTPRLDIALRAPYPGAVRVEKIPGDVTGVSIYVAEEDYLAKDHPYPLDRPSTTIREPKHIAVYDDGAPATVPVWQSSANIIGKRGTGKSSAEHVMIADLTCCYDEIVIVCDPKGAPLIGPWLRPYAEGRTDKPVLFAVASTEEEMRNVVAALMVIGEMRTKRLVSTDKVIPSPQLPHYTLIIDEAHRVIGTTGDKAVREGVKIIISQLRAAAIDILLASQRGTNSHMSSRDVRTQLSWTSLLNVADGSEVYQAIGKLQRAVDPTRFTAPGQMLLKLEGNTTRVAPARWLRLEEADIPALAERNTEWRATPPAEEMDVWRQFGVLTWWDTPGHTGYNVLSELRGQPVQAAPIDVAALISSTTASITKAPERIEPSVILADIITVMTSADTDRMPSAQLAEALAAEHDRYDGLTKYTLRTSLRGIVRPKQLGTKDGWDGNPRGYMLEDVQIALAQHGEPAQEALQAP